MAQFERAVSSLGDVEERLRRSLNLVGLISTDFSPEVVPVTIVDQADRPGCNVARGRFWSDVINSALATATINSYVLFATDPQIIKSVTIGAAQPLVPDATSGRIYMRLAAPGVIAAGGLATAGLCTENNRGQNDRPGVQAAVGAEQVLGSLFYFGDWRVGEINHIPLNLQLQSAAVLVVSFDHNGAGSHDIHLTVQGRKF